MKLYKEMTGRFFYLFSLLILLLILYPYVGHGGAGRVFIAILYITIPLSGIYAVSFSRRGLVISLILGIPFVLSGIDIFVGADVISPIISHISGIAFYAVSSVIILAHIIREKRIQADTLYGAVCVYLMFGLTWYLIYSFVEQLNPGSFYCGDAQNINGVLDGADLLYFSFVTLTTLGYGDITPVTAQVRSLSFLEAAAGTLYSAILVARLVGLYTAQFQVDPAVAEKAEEAARDNKSGSNTGN